MGKESSKDRDKQGLPVNQWWFWAIIAGVVVAIVITILVVAGGGNSESSGGGTGNNGGSSSNNGGNNNATVKQQCALGDILLKGDGTYKIPDDIPRGTYLVNIPGNNNRVGFNIYNSESDMKNGDEADDGWVRMLSGDTELERMLMIKSSHQYIVIDGADGVLQLICMGG